MGQEEEVQNCYHHSVPVRSALRRSSVNRRNHRFDAAASVEVTHHSHPLWRATADQVVEYSVYCAFVEDSVVAEAPQIEFETFELDAFCRGHVRDPNRSEIRRATLQQLQLGRVRLYAAERAKRCELRAVHVDLVVTVRVRIVEGFK